MKNKLTTVILLIFLIIFCIYQLMSEKPPTVLEVITPTILNIDLNANGITDDNETFCIADTDTYTANLKYDMSDKAKSAGLTYGQAVSVGYLTDNFARKTLEGKIVTIQEHDSISPTCRYASILIEDKDYSDLLKENGFTIKNNIPANQAKFQEILEKAKNLKLVILNHHSLKYHTLDCKYGRAAGDAIVLDLNEIPNDTKPCKFCHVEHDPKYKPNHQNDENRPQIAPPPNKVTDGNIQLIMSDFTTIIKPDRNCSHNFCKEFVAAVNSATKSIDIAAYGLSDIPAVIKALDDAKQRGVNIRIVYDTNTKQENYYSETDSILEKFSQIRSDNVLNSPQMTNMLMHNKFAIFDKNKVYTGSMNFSATGFSGFNHNAVVIINSKEVANIFEKEFEQMYNGKFHNLKKITTSNTDIPSGNNTISVFFSPQDKGFREALVPLIRNSKQYIYIPTFLFTHSLLKNELIAAKNRGVDVKIIIDATNTYGRHSVFKELRNSGIPVKVENYAGKMHAKTIIIDDEYLILGSANFSNSGENKNDENMLIIKSSKLTKAYKDYFNYFWQIIPDKYLKYTLKAESKDSIGSCYDGVDNDFDGKIDNADTDCRNSAK